MRRVIVWIRHGALVIEWLLGSIWYLLTFWIPRKKAHPTANVFNAVQHPGGVYLFGRVMALRVLSPPTPEDGKWVNFKRMASNWFTLDFPDARVEVVIAGRTTMIRANKEGYFELHESCDEVVETIEVRLPRHDYTENVAVVGHRDVAPLVVISDVDDTLVETGSISMAKMVETTLFGNSLTRELVPGMASLLTRLWDGGRHPVFYVTSSPWNLANFLKRLFKRANLPEGGLFMTKWGLTPEQWLTPQHDVHKRDSIAEVATWFPGARLIFIGDDSQRDPEIYAAALRLYGPERVSAILIRSVSGFLRENDVRQRFSELNEEFGEVAWIVDTAEEMKLVLERKSLV